MSIESLSADDSVNIRVEDSGSFEERSVIRTIYEAAFGDPDEADLVDRLRADGHALISLVAELDAGLVGHILFSRMWIRNQTGALVSAVALAPVAVLPEHQGRGIGGRLVRCGLELLRGRGERIAIVVGHPDYYPRFGFSTEKAQSLESPFPAEAFMVIELSAGALDGVQGSVVYPAAFGI
jgi:putative acetyltransferase